MTVTDPKTDRPEEPIGVNFMIENLHSLASPDFGPLKAPTEKWLTKKPPHFEGHTYLGFAVLLSTTVFLVTLLFKRRKPQVNRPASAIFLSGFIMLMLAFGYHFDLLEALNIESGALNQFRATCRFAWFFYYSLPVFVLPMIFKTFEVTRIIKYGAATLFLTISMLEAHYLFKLDEYAFWHFDNFFSEQFLTPEQEQIVSSIRASNCQAIIPLPIFHGGSELYDRLGSNNSMTPAMLYSFHCRLPILSVSLSRTSAAETEALIQTLNAYKKNRRVDSLFDQEDFLLLKTDDALLPDEKRLLKKATLIKQFDSLGLLKLSPHELKRPVFTRMFADLKPKDRTATNVIYINNSGKKPFSEASLMNIEMITSLQPKEIPPGPQIISLHLYYNRKHYKAVAGDLIVVKVTEDKAEWIKNIPLRILSGFYPGYAVFEVEVDLSPDTGYQFLINGWQKETYKISDFMIRQADQTVILKTGNDTISINNFPLH